jgi:uncharacterized protein (DUF2062 family)
MSIDPQQRPGFFQRRVLAPIIRQLTQGTNPAKLALALAIGTTIAINPFIGTTTLGCFAAGILLGLNQPALQVANVLGAPLQLLLIVPWVRTGEWLFGAAPMPINPAVLAEQFSSAPFAFLQRFGLTSLHAGIAWLLSAPIIGFILFLLLRPPLRLLAARSLRSKAEPVQAGNRPL